MGLAVLLVEVWASQRLSCEHGRLVPITNLSCGGMARSRGRGEMPSLTLTHQCLRQVGELTNISDPQQLQHSGEWPFHRAWVTQWSWP